MTLAELKETISSALRAQRAMGDSTCRTYTSLLSTMYTKLGGKSLKFFEETAPIMEYINGLSSIQTKKTICAALWVLTGIDAYNTQMRESMQQVTANYREQKTDPKRKDKMISFADVCGIHAQLLAKCKKNPTLENLNNAALSGVMSGAYGDECPPRRLTDYTEMKFKNFSKTDDNYTSGTTMNFNIYKTVKHDKAKGVHPTLTVPAMLRPLFAKLKKNTENGDYLFTNSLGKKFTSSALNKRMTGLFGFGCDMLRSIYLSEIYKDVPAQSAMEARAEKMGHSVDAIAFYSKKDV